MGFFGKQPDHAGKTRLSVSPSIAKMVEEFVRLAKLDEVEDERIRRVLAKLRSFLALFQSYFENFEVNKKLLEQEYHYILPTIINELLAIDADLKREIKFCFECGEKVRRGSVACPSCGVDLKG